MIPIFSIPIEIPAQLVSTLNTELINVANWIKANKLSLNLQKTNYILFSNSITQLPNQVIFSETVINEVKSTRFLGITIDNKLDSSNYHIDNICKTVSRNIGIINRVKQFRPLSVLLTLYSTFILHLNCGILAWGNSAEIRIGRLILLQKRVMRIICNTSHR